MPGLDPIFINCPRDSDGVFFDRLAFLETDVPLGGAHGAGRGLPPQSCSCVGLVRIETGIGRRSGHPHTICKYVTAASTTPPSSNSKKRSSLCSSRCNRIRSPLSCLGGNISDGLQTFGCTRTRRIRKESLAKGRYRISFQADRLRHGHVSPCTSRLGVRAAILAFQRR
jgi:hypothetical protein